MMARDGISVQDYVALELERATEELVAFQHQQILKALKEHPEGVSAAYFKKMKNEGVELSVPRAVTVAMNDSHALTYRIELCKYVMLPRSYEVALRNYEPIVPFPLSPADIAHKINKLNWRAFWQTVPSSVSLLIIFSKCQ